MSNRPFGYADDGTVIEDEAAQMRASAAAITSGQSSFSAEARRLEAAGAYAPGRGWYPARVSRMLTSPRVVGDRPPVRGGVPAPILDRATYDQLRAAAEDRLQTRFGRPTGGGTSDALLADLCDCARCGATLKLSGAKERRTYRCPSNRRLGDGRVACGRTQIVQAGTDAFVSARALDAWAAGASTRARANGVPALADARRELEVVTAASAGLPGQLAAGLLSRDEHATQARRFATRAARLREQITALEALGLPEADGEDIYDWWDQAPADRRRALVGAVYPRITINSAAHPGPARGSDAVDPARITLHETRGA